MHSFAVFVHRNRVLCNGFLPVSPSPPVPVLTVAIPVKGGGRRSYKRLVIGLHTACNPVTNGL